MHEDLSAIDAEAVAGLRSALLAGTGFDEAVQRVSSRYPYFAVALLIEALRRRFGLSHDVREVTAFTRQLGAGRSRGAEPFPARQAEILIRVVLGEVELISASDPVEAAAYPDLDVVILSSLLEEWQPGPGELDGLTSF